MILDDTVRNFIIEKYLRQAVVTKRHKNNGPNEILTECIYCGEKRPKGTLFKSNTGRWCYICWKANCECSSKAIIADKWLKKADPSLYQSYVNEVNQEVSESYVTEVKKEAKESAKRAEVEQQKELQEKMKNDLEAARHFKKISVKGRNQQLAIDFCKKRHIPKAIYSGFYYADEGKYKNRVIIPFRNKENKIVFFQGRALDNNDVKYLSKIGNTALYNIDFRDKNKPLIITEGPIDSMFIENSTATVGAGSSKQIDEQLSEFKRYWLYDNDEAGERKSKEKLAEHEYVFMWKKYLLANNLTNMKIKDINDLVIATNMTDKYTYDMFANYFTNNELEFNAYNY